MASIKVRDPLFVPLSVFEESRQLLAQVERLRQDDERLERENERLRRRTPAMAEGLADHVRAMGERITMPCVRRR